MQEPVVAAAGINRWDTVHFDDLDRREKFHKLMVLGHSYFDFFVYFKVVGSKSTCLTIPGGIGTPKASKGKTPIC